MEYPQIVGCNCEEKLDISLMNFTSHFCNMEKIYAFCFAEGYMALLVTKQETKVQLALSFPNVF